jgi:glucosamine 6-phosphate synthetase-like amidotransferase/phosphosugar isomerase protein
LQALNYAKQQGALCVGVTNTVGSAIATATDCGIHVNAGCEIGVASTKAYTSQIVAITLLALVMAEDSVSRKRKYDAVVSALRHLPDSVRKVRSPCSSVGSQTAFLGLLIRSDDARCFHGHWPGHWPSIYRGLVC